MSNLDSAWFHAQVCDIMDGNRLSDAEVDRRMSAIGLPGWRAELTPMTSKSCEKPVETKDPLRP